MEKGLETIAESLIRSRSKLSINSSAAASHTASIGVGAVVSTVLHAHQANAEHEIWRKLEEEFLEVDREVILETLHELEYEPELIQYTLHSENVRFVLFENGHNPPPDFDALAVAAEEIAEGTAKTTGVMVLRQGMQATGRQAGGVAVIAVISAVDISKELYRYRIGKIDQKQLQKKSVGHVVRVSGSAMGGAAGAAVGGGMAAAAAAGGTYGAAAGPAGAMLGGVLGAAAVGMAADRAYTTVSSPTHADAFVGHRNATTAQVLGTGVSKFVGGAASTSYNVASGVGKGTYAAGTTLQGGVTSAASSASSAASSVAHGIGYSGWAAATSVVGAASYWSGFGGEDWSKPPAVEEQPATSPTPILYRVSTAGSEGSCQDLGADLDKEQATRPPDE